MWALDLDQDNRPYQAHAVMSDNGGVRVLACGVMRTVREFPTQWTNASIGGLYVHCGSATPPERPSSRR
jgi:hypothetical protein